MRVLLVAIAVVAVSPQTVRGDLVFAESMGSVAGTTSFATHTTNMGWDNDGYTFTGTGDVRATTASSGYTGATGSANVFLTDNGTANFQIAAIDTMAFLPTFTLSFGAWKELVASDMSTLSLAYSDDGVSYTSLTIPAQPTGAGTAVWRLISLSGITLPNVSNLRLRWTNTGVDTSQFRVDDMMLQGTAVPEPGAAHFGLLVLALASAGWCGNKLLRTAFLGGLSPRHHPNVSARN